MNLLDTDKSRRMEFAIEYQRVKSFEIPLCCLCSERKRFAKLVELADGNFYHLNSCAQQ